MLDRVLSDLALVYNIFINSLVVLIIHLYIETQREVQLLPFTFIYLNTFFSKFLWLNGVFHHFCSIVNILSYSNDWGGGLCGENIPIY